MESAEKKNSMNVIDLFRIIGAVLSAFGGLAAVFIVFGYITILSRLSSAGLYSLVSFSGQFYKEVNISFLRDIAGFYSSNILSFAIALLIISAALVRPQRLGAFRHLAFLRKAGRALILLFTIFVVFLTFTLDFFEKISKSSGGRLLGGLSKERTFYILSLPVALAVTFYLINSFKKFDLREPFKNHYFLFFVVLVFLLISIPIGYGTYLYKIPLFPSSKPELVAGAEIDAFKDDSGGQYKLYYVMGQTSDKEVFFDLTDYQNTQIIIVDKNLIKSVKITYLKALNLGEALNPSLPGPSIDERQFEK